MTRTSPTGEEPAGIAEEDLHIVGERLPPPREVHDPWVAVAAVATVVGALVFGFGLTFGAPTEVYGAGLTVALLAFAFAFYRYFTGEYPEIEAVEPRPGADDVGDLDEVAAPPRRNLLGWMLAAAAGVLGISLAAPVSSLGPSVGDTLRRTQWRPGARLVTTAGRTLRPGDIQAGSLVTAFPEHAIEHERSAVVVLRLGPRGPLEPTNTDWIVDGTLVAYSKICTHAGCPVGLFRERDDVLFCPCHQATFDAARAAQPVFGPAARPLAQLPLDVDDEGVLIALDDFSVPIGPPYGWMGRIRAEPEGDA